MAMKQLETKREKVGDYVFYIRPFSAFKASNLTGELASVLVPLLGVFAPLIAKSAAKKGAKKETNGEGSLMDIDVNDAAAAIGNCSGIDGDKLEFLLKKLLLGGHIIVELEDGNGKVEPQRLDEDLANEVFCGEVQNMFILSFHVIKMNFNGFFENLVNLFGKAGLAEDEEEEQTTPRAIF